MKWNRKHVLKQMKKLKCIGKHNRYTNGFSEILNHFSSKLCSFKHCFVLFWYILFYVVFLFCRDHESLPYFFLLCCFLCTVMFSAKWRSCIVFPVMILCFLKCCVFLFCCGFIWNAILFCEILLWICCCPVLSNVAWWSQSVLTISVPLPLLAVGWSCSQCSSCPASLHCC